MAISCLGFNTIALFSRQIFKIDDAPVNASLIFWFCFAEMICSVPRNSPMGDYQNIWLTGEHSEPIGTIRTLACGPTQKSPPSVQAVFQVASAPISSRFLCPRPPLLLSAPSQNRHATQAIFWLEPAVLPVVIAFEYIFVIVTLWSNRVLRVDRKANVNQPCQQSVFSPLGACIRIWCTAGAVEQWSQMFVYRPFRFPLSLVPHSTKGLFTG